MGRPNNATPEHIAQECVRLFGQGKMIVEISEIVHVGRATVRAVLDRAGVDRRVHTIKNRPDAVLRCAELVKGGLPVKRAVRTVNSELRLSFSASTYYEAMIREGLYAKVSKDEQEVEPEPVGGPDPKTEIEFDGLIIRKMQVRVPAHDSRNGYAMISLPAVGMAAQVAA
jgi:hypothetical protein